MKFPHFFIDRPIFAAVLSILIVIVGAIAYPTLPTAQYPEIAPPTVVVTATYPGASAETLAETVSAPIEQAINGVQDMIYMSSSSTGNGTVQITVSFAQGVNVDQAQVLVQNRVSTAEPRLPEDVRRIGVTVNKSSPDLLLVSFFYSPDKSLDQQYIANYVTLQVLDRISRVQGVGSTLAVGGRDYNMRIWIDPGLAAARDMTVDEVVAAIRAQNVQVAAGSVGQPPFGKGSAAFELGIQTKGRLTSPEEFGQVIVKRDDRGRLTRLRDIARIELGAQDYGTNSYMGEKTAVALGVNQLPGSNALTTSEAVRKELAEIAKGFPPGMAYSVPYDSTVYIQESINEVVHTLVEAVILVALVVLIFLQSWRAAIIPIIAIPISLVGSLAVLAAFGYSLNSLSLFGLVLAIGIVVDDAIVVIENVERLMKEEGLGPREAAHKTMDEVSGALIGIALVLVGVFVPTMFIPGISGQFYKQFALTISSATLISAFVSLTLSPALAAIILRPQHDATVRPGWRGWPAKAANGFNHGFERLSDRYGKLTARLVRMLAVIGIVYVLLIGIAGWRFYATPTGFIPTQDQGYLIGVVQLPPGSSLDRTDAVLREAIGIAMKNPAMKTAIGFAGFDGATFSNAPNAGAIFFTLKDHGDRDATAEQVMGQLYGAFGGITGGDILVIQPPPVNGIGTGGGFKMMIEDRSGAGYAALAAATMQMMAGANAQPGVAGAFSTFNVGTPRLTADIDRERAERMGVPVQNVFSTLSAYLGSAYINDFNFLGRTFRVTAQADAPYRNQPSDIPQLKTRSATGQMVPLAAVLDVKNDAGPYRVVRYNLYPAAELQGDTKPGFSTGQSLKQMEELAAKTLPKGFSFDWTELAYQQKQAGNTGIIAFGLAVVFVFLLLAALYESLVLPLAVILIVPMCLLAAIVGVGLFGMDNNILTQIGLVVLIGLAAKNAILIVEFAKQGEDEGLSIRDAAQRAAHQRMRPIIMTSIAFILGVLPLVIGSGPGSEMRKALGVAVFCGMIGVTLFGLIFTPAFYVISRTLGVKLKAMSDRMRHKRHPAGEQEAGA
ncbi:multidrug efflux RND transporter permease subunit [Sphingomonas naphthae]|uniref:Efflux pump membrane transporter n=1 Tax=Sphingomonas naphthae TaxID=1813468 RepID=A0ABY7TNE9_9SPHN|nr:multidrug efflux RND transporter permease subunit [Sphingomonas naphthae]WCT74761.1 multidrug efflux RND transporter permease subunit [Sphingomonas naphthae]